MQFSNKKIGLAVSLILASTTWVFADSFNPFQVFDSSDNQQASSNDVSSGAASTSAVATPTAATAPLASTSSATPTQPKLLQPQPLITPATGGANNAQKTTTQQPAYSTNMQPLPADRYNAANTTTAATIGLPISGSGGSSASPNTLQQQAPVTGGGILEVLNSINKTVFTINNNMTNWQTQKAKDEAGSAANLVPTSTTNLNKFIFNQSGYSMMLALQKISANFVNALAAVNPLSSEKAASAGMILTPMTQTQFKRLTANLSADAKANVTYQKVASNYVLSLDDSSLVSLVIYAVAQVAAQTMPVGDSDSMMSIFQTAVEAPFAPKSANNDPSWFDQLATASTPQLLRSIAILLAEHNQMQYQTLKNQQALVVLSAGQLQESAKIDVQLAAMVDAQKQTNVLLNQLINQAVAQNNKK